MRMIRNGAKIDELTLPSKPFVKKEEIHSWNLKQFFPYLTDTYKFFVDVWEHWDVLLPTERNIGTTVRHFIDYGHEVMILTSQQPETMGNIVLWLEYHDIPHSALSFVPHMRNKGKYPADVYIDDYPYLAQFLPDGKRQLLYTQPWNTDVPNSDKVTRVANLDEAFKLLSK